MREVRAGVDHSAAIDSNGTLYVWGNGGSGKLGLGNQVARNGATILPLGEKVADVDLGASHTIVLTKLGRVFTFGSNSEGQLGTGGGSTLVPVEVALADTSVNFIRAAAFGSFAETGGLLRYVAKHAAYPREIDPMSPGGPIYRRGTMHADRAEYWNDDRSGQLVASFIEGTFGSVTAIGNDALRIELKDPGGQLLQTKHVEPPLLHHAQILVGTEDLPLGASSLCATLISGSADATIACGNIVRANRSWPAVTFPLGGVALQLQPSPTPSSEWPGIENGSPGCSILLTMIARSRGWCSG